LDLGKIITKGTVDEIKKKFGIGYNLVLNLDKNQEHFEQEILKRIPGSYRDENKEKHQFVLPFKSVDKFPDLFSFLEELEVTFSLKQTSLEDAFLNFTDIQNVANKKDS